MDASAVSALQDRMMGRVVLPGHPSFEQARRVWNGMIDRRPALIARCYTTQDVIEALRFSRGRDLTVAVRGGGHSVAGFSTCDGGVLLDLGAICHVSVDPDEKVATVGGGALLSQVDQATQKFGLACPTGVVGHTGVGGLTLGGGMGRLQRRFGFSIDNLLGVELVTAAGRVVRASADENPELFWGMRGAGANFGVVTTFSFQLQPVGPTIVQGDVTFPIDRTPLAAELFRDLSESAPDELSFFLGFAVEARGPAVYLQVTHCGPIDAGERYVRRLRESGPIGDTLGEKSYLAVQVMGDEASAWGHRFYMKNAFFDAVPDEVTNICADRISLAPGQCSISFMAQGGAIARIPEDATAFAGRHARSWCSIEAMWDEPGDDQEFIAWTRQTMDVLRPFSVEASYVNDVAEPGLDVARTIYGDAKYRRLGALKREWDPENVLRMNHNITPAVWLQ
jgi:FAD/FMN-containing dehydrogenase